MSLQFEWSERKAAMNASKHGISFDEATTVFGDFFSVTIEDPLHSEKEVRFVTIGTSNLGNIIVIVHTDRGDRIRIIGARRATPREKREYAKGSIQ